MMHNRKSQAAIFIIVGIIILFSVVLILFLRGKGPEVAKIPIITEEVPTEMQPIRTFVEKCIESTATEAIKLIGAHGGYIGLEKEDFKYTHKNFKLDPSGNNPTEYDAITISSDWKVPYWWYLVSSNKCSGDCLLTTLRPPLKKEGGENSIESQIERYVEINLPSCLGDFASFKQQGKTIKNASGVKATATIAEKDVNIFVVYPLEIEWQGGKATLSQFSSTIDVNLKRIYELASEITQKEIGNSFLEAHVLNLIAIYSGMDENKLPPMAGTELAFVSKRWRASEVKEVLQDLLSVYINVLMTTDTYGFRIPYIEGNPLATGLYTAMVVDIKPKTYVGDIKVSYNYLGWPIYFYITGGEMITARESIPVPILSALMPVQRYDLPYDVSFPVMVNLRDPGAFKGEGYDFIFALEGNIRNNEPMKTGYYELKTATLGGASMQFCEEDQRRSGNVSLRAVDNMGKPIKGVYVLYQVGETACAIGETDENGILNTKFPTGGIGAIVLQHPDYITKRKEPFRAREEEQSLGDIVMKGYVIKNITAKVMDIDKLIAFSTQEGLPLKKEWTLNFGTGRRPLMYSPNGVKERALIMLTRNKHDPRDEDLIAAADIYNGNKSEVRLAPGKYKLSITLIQENVTIEIPEEELCIEGNVIVEDCEEKEKIGPTCLTKKDKNTGTCLPGTFLAGEYEAEIEFGNEIYNNNTIEFTAVNFNLLEYQEESKHKDLEKWSKVEEIVNENKEWFNFYVYTPNS